MADGDLWSALEAISAFGAAVAAGCGLRFAYATVKQNHDAAERDRKREIAQQKKELAHSQEALAHAKEELRWRQTVAAQESIHRMINDQTAAQAMLMLDWNGRSFKVYDDRPRIRIAWDDMRFALRTDNTSFRAPEVFVRDSFDALFHHFQIIMHQINNNMYNFEDIKYPIGYYSARISLPENWEPIQRFLTKYDYDLAIMLIERTHDQSKRLDVAAYHFTEDADDIISWEQALSESKSGE